jgi:hypothetical protein
MSFLAVRGLGRPPAAHACCSVSIFAPLRLCVLLLLSFDAGTIDQLVAEGTLHPECAKIFRLDKSDNDHTGKPLLLHTHWKTWTPTFLNSFSVWKKDLNWTPEDQAMNQKQRVSRIFLSPRNAALRR